jgi:hypothetical protein
MRIKYIVVVVVIIIFFLIALGSVTGEQCISIDNDKACWKIASVFVTSELCPNVSVSCEAKPEQQQYNAIADLLLRSCQKAQTSEYSDTALNERIEEVLQNFLNLDISAQELCNQPGMVLTKRQYGS